MSRGFWFTVTLTVVSFTALIAWQRSMASSNVPSSIDSDRPAKALVIPANARVATFAGGCFWGIEEAFRSEPGVLTTQTGYTGGKTPSPTYRIVHRDNTGHVEAVEVVYDPAKTSYDHLLQVFFDNHDPTLPRPRAGRTIGDAYRSYIFYQDATQEKAARTMIHSLTAKKQFYYPIATQVKPALTFWPAEEYHQQYYKKQGTVASCKSPYGT